MISAGDVIDGTEAKLLANGKKKIDITTKNVVDKYNSEQAYSKWLKEKTKE